MIKRHSPFFGAANTERDWRKYGKPMRRPRSEAASSNQAVAPFHENATQDCKGVTAGTARPINAVYLFKSKWDGDFVVKIHRQDFVITFAHQIDCPLYLRDVKVCTL